MTDEKRKLRGQLKHSIENLSPEQRRQEEIDALRVLRELKAWKESRNLLIFLSMSGEFDTLPIFMEARELSKKVWTPRMYGRTMKFHLLSTPEMAPPSADRKVFNPEDYKLNYNPYGIWEPHRNLPVFPGDAEKNEKTLVISPGLAFDRRGNRLGRGRGYYDRWFSSISGTMQPELLSVLGIGYSVQLVDEVPHNEQDVALPLLLIGGELIRCI